MKKERLLILLCGICLVLVLAALPFMAACAKPKPEVKPIELSLALMVPPTHTRYTGCMEPWIKLFEERTGGKVKIVPYFAEALAKSTEIYDATVQGISDTGEVVTYFTPGRFPLSNFFLVPGLAIPDNATASRLHWHFYETVPEFGAQYAETKLICLYAQTRTMVMSTKPIHSLEDFKGMKFYSGGPLGAEVGKALGFTPVAMSMADVYMAVEKGVLDGVVSNINLLAARKFGEIMKHVTYGVGLGGAMYLFGMNLDTWKSLPPDVQKAFNELGGVSGSEFFGKGMDDEDENAIKVGKEKYGVEFFELPPEEAARWNKILDGVREQWINDLENKGLPGKKIFEEYQRFVLAGK